MSSAQRRRWVVRSYQMLKRSERHLPRILRGFLGLVMIAFGFLGFLPILGFWMIPLGVVLLATDIPPLRRRLMLWLHKHRRVNRPAHRRKPEL